MNGFGRPPERQFRSKVALSPLGMHNFRERGLAAYPRSATIKKLQCIRFPRSRDAMTSPFSAVTLPTMSLNAGLEGSQDHRRVVVSLLNVWLNEPGEYDAEVWPVLAAELTEDRVELHGDDSSGA